jgi:hypothetical protein
LAAVSGEQTPKEQSNCLAIDGRCTCRRIYKEAPEQGSILPKQWNA